jgi:hypothetical protein
VRLVNDDRKTPPAVFAADFIKDEGKLLERRDDDLFAALDEPPQVS